MKEKKSSFKGKLVNSYRRQKETRGSFGYLTLPKGVEMFKIPEDTRSFLIDLIPYIVTSEKHLDRNVEDKLAMSNTLWYRMPIKVHRNVGANNESIICPTIIGKKCPICEYRVKIIKEGADKETFKLLYPQERSVYPVIPLGKDFEQVPMIWDMSDYLFQETLMDELKEREDCEDFFTLDNGKTVVLRLKWKEIGKNKYPEVVSIDFRDREPYEENVLDDVPSLDSILKILPYEEIAAKFFEEDVTDEELEEIPEEEAVEETPRKAKSYHRQAKQEPEEEEAPKTFQRSRRTAERTEEAEVEEAPKPERHRRNIKEEPSKNKCPYGHKFGVDTDEYKDCNTCEIWDECDEEKEKNK